MSFVDDIVQNITGLGPTQISELEAALPSTKRLVDILITAQPLITQAEPLVTQALAEWAILGPIVKDVIGVLAAHEAAGNSKENTLLKIRDMLASLKPPLS